MRRESFKKLTFSLYEEKVTKFSHYTKGKSLKIPHDVPLNFPRYTKENSPRIFSYETLKKTIVFTYEISMQYREKFTVVVAIY